MSYLTDSYKPHSPSVDQYHHRRNHVLTALERDTLRLAGRYTAQSSHVCPGHRARMSHHIDRIAGADCRCGSGRLYGDCCMFRSDQEQRELLNRQ